MAWINLVERRIFCPYQTWRNKFLLLYSFSHRHPFYLVTASMWWSQHLSEACDWYLTWCTCERQYLWRLRDAYTFPWWVILNFALLEYYLAHNEVKTPNYMFSFIRLTVIYYLLIHAPPVCSVWHHSSIDRTFEALYHIAAQHPRIWHLSQAATPQ